MTTDQPVSALQHAIDVLNRIHEADPRVMTLLIATRVFCNDELAADPTVQVGRVRAPARDEPGLSEVGFLGVLNGIFGVDDDGWGYIAATYDDDGNLTGFDRTPMREEDSR